MINQNVEHKIELAKIQIQRYNITDEDLQQEVMLIYLTEDNDQQRNRRFKNLLKKHQEQQKQAPMLLGIEYLGRLPQEEGDTDDLLDEIEQIAAAAQSYYDAERQQRLYREEMEELARKQLKQKLMSELTDRQQTVLVIMLDENDFSVNSIANKTGLDPVMVRKAQSGMITRVKNLEYSNPRLHGELYDLLAMLASV